jgi:hypothetical protein
MSTLLTVRVAVVSALYLGLSNMIVVVVAAASKLTAQGFV